MPRGAVEGPTRGRQRTFRSLLLHFLFSSSILRRTGRAYALMSSGLKASQCANAACVVKPSQRE